MNKRKQSTDLCRVKKKNCLRQLTETLYRQISGIVGGHPLSYLKYNIINMSKITFLNIYSFLL